MSEQLDLEIANELPPTLKKWNEPIPLTMPDGRVLVYACPQCLQAQSNVIGGDIEGRREDSFRDARRHCCCLECGAQLGRLFGLRCDDCQAKALREREAMKPVWDGKEFVPRLMLPLSLTADHRVIDGALATRFNVYVAQLLADMRRMML